MSCSNCYNGCTEIVSDQCVKYTGVDIPALGIKSGDSLSYVEQTLIGFLVSTLDGSGIVINIPQSSYCTLVTKYLPTCGDITASVLFEALVKAACDLQIQVTANATAITTQTVRIDKIEADYVTNCLTGVTPSSGTHNILQAVITALCALTLDVENNYVLISDINTYIANYLATNNPTNNVSNKMVPYVALPYFGMISGNFDNTGAGIIGSIWEKIYLCNGDNNTPDLRGRVTVGATTGMNGTIPLSPVVDPIFNNPNYSISSTAGSNNITLTTSQMPIHTHINTISITDPGHTHSLPNVYNEGGNGHNASGGGDNEGPISDLTGSSTTGITATLTNASAGGSFPHPNFQPGIGCFYIMYIP